MEYLIVGICVFLNIAFIKWKFDKARYSDSLLDTTLLVGVMYLFSGSYGALVIGTVASAMISVFLFFSPPKALQ